MSYLPEWCVLELEPDVWTAYWEGDPGRTTRLEHAVRYVRPAIAEEDLKVARQYRPFVNARIIPSDPPPEWSGRGCLK